MAAGHRAAWALAHRRGLRAASSHVCDRHNARTRLRAALETPLKGPSAPMFLFFFSLFCRRRHLALPLTAVTVELLLAKTTTPSRLPRSCAPPGPTAPVHLYPNHPHDHFLSHRRWPSVTEPPHVASPLHRLPAPPSFFTALTVSSCCLSCIQFNRY
jgi:hypothetical protein